MVSNFNNEEKLGGGVMSSGTAESRALLAVRVITLAPLLWFLLGGGAIAKIAGKDWMPIEAFAWPVMVAPVALTLVYLKYRRDIQVSENVPNVRWLVRIAAGLFIVANGALILYSWSVVIPAALCVAILLDGLINGSAKEAP
ncbi:hypothetical protein [Streptomyces sioyaensis]|uniref:hypothetical protein n=1 Tax=Streptomyces sioyaensis TaxID=67364 RepID=UPI0037B1599B